MGFHFNLALPPSPLFRIDASTVGSEIYFYTLEQIQPYRAIKIVPFLFYTYLQWECPLGCKNDSDRNLCSFHSSILINVQVVGVSRYALESSCSRSLHLLLGLAPSMLIDLDSSNGYKSFNHVLLRVVNETPSTIHSSSFAENFPAFKSASS